MLWKILLKPLLALLLFAVVAVAVAIALNQPPLLDQPGIGARTWTYLTRNSAETGDIAAFPELRTRTYADPPQQVYEAALAAAEVLGWEISHSDPAALSFDAVATTRLWRFQDQVEVRVHAGEQGGGRIQMRSYSLFGHADFGANARRIVEFHELLERRL